MSDPFHRLKSDLIAAGWTQLQAIRKDEHYSAPVEGGVAQREAKRDGLVLRMRDHDVVLEADAVALVMRELGWTCEPPGAAAAREKWATTAVIGEPIDRTKGKKLRAAK